VVTAAPQHGVEFPGVECVPDRVGELLEGGGAAQKSKSRRPAAALFEIAMRRWVVPGVTGTTWSAAAASACRTILSQHAGEQVTLLSTFPPLGTHLAALLASRRAQRAPQVRWIADFRDPMSFALQFSKDARLARAVLAGIERLVFHRADLILANTERVAERWRALYPTAAGKIRVLWNGFDPQEDLSAQPLPDPSRKLLVHTGCLYSGRNPNAILESLCRLRRTAPDRAEKARILLVGPIGVGSGLNQAVVDQGVLEGWLEVVPRLIPQNEARAITRQAAGNLILQPQSDSQVPGKLFECIRVGRPVLALIPRNSSVEWILSRAGVPYRCIYSDDDAAAADAKLLDFLSLPDTPVEPGAWFVENFSAPVQAQILARWIDSLHCDRR
jgi:glycosyltransferase involved in cell wall biosynthesis